MLLPRRRPSFRRNTRSIFPQRQSRMFPPMSTYGKIPPNYTKLCANSPGRNFPRSYTSIESPTRKISPTSVRVPTENLIPNKTRLLFIQKNYKIPNIMTKEERQEAAKKAQAARKAKQQEQEAKEVAPEIDLGSEEAPEQEAKEVAPEIDLGSEEAPEQEAKEVAPEIDLGSEDAPEQEVVPEVIPAKTPKLKKVEKEFPTTTQLVALPGGKYELRLLSQRGYKVLCKGSKAKCQAYQDSF